jgi:hypothetical protein
VDRDLPDYVATYLAGADDRPDSREGARGTRDAVARADRGAWEGRPGARRGGRRAPLRDVLDPLTEASVAEPGTSSARIRQELAGAIGPLTAVCTALVEHPRLRELWPEYLVLQHQIIRATVPLTETALDRTRAALTESDPLRAPLAAYLEEHVDEELNHDDGLLDDLESLGLPRAEVLARMPSASVAAVVGAQYYWIHHHHPVAFLGYIALMEGYPPTAELIETLAERTGYPPEAFRTFDQHAELDPGHKDHLDRTLDALPLTHQQEAMIVVSATATAALSAQAVSELLDLPVRR